MDPYSTSIIDELLNVPTYFIQRVIHNGEIKMRL